MNINIGKLVYKKDSSIKMKLLCNRIKKKKELMKDR